MKVTMERKAQIRELEFMRRMNGMIVAGVRVREVIKKWPNDVPLPIPQEYREAVETAKRIVDRLLRIT